MSSRTESSKIKQLPLTDPERLMLNLKDWLAD